MRNWIRQDEADRSQRDYRPTTLEVEELRRLWRKNAEMKRANEILKAASAPLHGPPILAQADATLIELLRR